MTEVEVEEEKKEEAPVAPVHDKVFNELYNMVRSIGIGLDQKQIGQLRGAAKRAVSHYSSISQTVITEKLILVKENIISVFTGQIDLLKKRIEELESKVDKLETKPVKPKAPKAIKETIE